MARWRPPTTRSSPYITPDGERALRAELKELVVAPPTGSGSGPERGSSGG